MNGKYEITALLPMKGHSERVPSKNIRELNGCPLFFYILETLLKAEHVFEVLVNTDSEVIKRYLLRKCPEVIILDRPDFLLGAKVPMGPIIAYDLKYAKCEHFLQTHATVPLLKSETIDKAIEEYFHGLEKGYDSLMGVTKHQTRFYDENRIPINHNPKVMVPSQDMPYLYEDNSTLYINSVENFYHRQDRIGKNPLFFCTPKLESIDIDEEEDFIITEALLSMLNRRGVRGKCQ